MASSKARSRNRTPAAAARGGARSGARPARPASRTGGGAAAATRAQQRRSPAPEPVVEQPSGPPAWLKIAALLLAVAGLGVSSYLTYTHFTDSSLLGCSETAGAVNCTKVTTSSQSMIFGVIPVAVTGLIYYVFVVAIMSPWAWNSTWKWMPRLRLATMIAGIGMVLYLVYAELFQIGAICLYCTSVHVITFVLFAVITVSAAIWGLAPGPGPDSGSGSASAKRTDPATA